LVDGRLIRFLAGHSVAGQSASDLAFQVAC